jgi:hypothetical protein
MRNCNLRTKLKTNKAFIKRSSTKIRNKRNKKEDQLALFGGRERKEQEKRKDH